MNDKRRIDRYQAQQALISRMQKEINDTSHWVYSLKATKANVLKLVKKVSR